MATQEFEFSGEAQWAKTYKPDEKYNNYTIDVFLDAESWKKFEESGLTLTPKEYNGRKFVTFRRPHVKLIKNATVVFGPVIVGMNNDAGEFTPWGTLAREGRQVIFTPKDAKTIGNGSLVTVKVSVYDTQKGKGHRLEGVRVDKLVEYNGEGATPSGPPKLPF